MNSRNSVKRYKLVVVGDGACGKTSLLTVFKTGIFPKSEYVPTVFESDIAYMNVDNVDIELSLWDTAGQEFYDRLRILTYPADVIIICFAIDRPETLANVRKRWIPEVRQHCKGVPILLVGNKIDLRDDRMVLSNLRKVQKAPVLFAETRSMAYSINATAFHECSAKLLDGVNELFFNGSKSCN
ncbi:uncharacterized protein [Lepeophtheirus salmonis]|uniref:uncharacterized protein n=1 Tax=Lepeophtheirus salmonis TaxID=72036 RepID=UPI001AE4FA13|nr:GTP-binding protein rho5-like [Lepeophtheirus salmonis]